MPVHAPAEYGRWFPMILFSALPLNFCNKKQEIGAGTWVAGIARFGFLMLILGFLSKGIENPVNTHFTVSSVEEKSWNLKQ